MRCVVLSETWLYANCLTWLHWGYWWFSCDCKGTEINVCSTPRRKHYTSQNVLAAVDFDMRFTYMLDGWEGSAHDASILSDSFDGLQIPEGKFYLGDVGYACWPSILPPFRKTRYHLNKFTATNRPQNVKELFNLRHSILRVAIERAFAALENRFKVIDQKPFHIFDTQVKLVLACNILHNWILGWGEDDFFEEIVNFKKVETGPGVEALQENPVYSNTCMCIYIPILVLLATLPAHKNVLHFWVLQRVQCNAYTCDGNQWDWRCKIATESKQLSYALVEASMDWNFHFTKNYFWIDNFNFTGLFGRYWWW